MNHQMGPPIRPERLAYNKGILQRMSGDKLAGAVNAIIDGRAILV